MKLTAMLVACLLLPLAWAQDSASVRTIVQREKQPLLDTLKDLVSIESGSSDFEGVTRIGNLIADRLRALGGDVEKVPPATGYPRFQNTPARLADTIVARFRGKGAKRILLLAHMDTVYAKGMLAKQPFRIEGDRAYGLGIGDDKHGVATILHVLSALRALSFDQYGLITVLISPDEEIGSNAERDLITSLASNHDLVLSYEGCRVPGDDVRLATTGVQLALLTVKGRASHAGAAPEQGRNALYELSHQVLQMQDMSNPSKALKLNWTVATAGSVSNAIPEDATAMGDMRADDEADFAGLEAAIREKIRKHLIADTSVDVRFERLYPAMALRKQSLPYAQYAQRIYAENGGKLDVATKSPGSGTDAAFAALKTNAPILEGLGLRMYGAHSNEDEYVVISSIEPRLYLSTRLIVDFSLGKIPEK
ncbi:MAG: glutamate carboxypeptidase [Acidobacteriota bacterium]